MAYFWYWYWLLIDGDKCNDWLMHMHPLIADLTVYLVHATCYVSC